MCSGKDPLEEYENIKVERYACQTVQELVYSLY